MASSPIEINMALNTSAVAKGASDAEQHLTDLEQAVEGIGDSSRDADRLEQSLEDVGDQARLTADDIDDFDNVLTMGLDKGERKLGDLERAMRDVQREADDMGDAGRRMGDDLDRGFKRAEDGADDFRQEAGQTARETAASFDGSAESIGEAFQEVAANAFGGFGPAGAIAGLAAAAGIGAAIQGFEDVDEANEESQRRAADWAQSFIDAGALIISNADQVARVQAIATDPEQYEEARKNAENWGVDTSWAMRAMAGDATALTVVEESLAQAQADLDDKMTTNTDSITGMSDEMKTAAGQLNDGRDAFERLTGEMDAGREGAQAVSDALIGMVNSADDATVQVDDLGNRVYTLKDEHGETQIFVDADTGLASENIDAFNGELDEVDKRTVTSTVSVDVDDTAYRMWQPDPKVARVVVQTDVGRREVYAG